MKKLQVTQNSMLRNILGVRIKDKVSLEKIYAKTKAKKVWRVAKTLKLRYAGHIARENKAKWNHTLTTWVPHRGKRKRGQPRTRWADELTSNFGTNWMRKATDRTSWKGLVKTYAQKWAAEGVGGE